MLDEKIHFIDEVKIENKKILLRADFDVSLNSDHTIANDARIRSNLPTINYLLERNNRLISVAKLNRPKGRDLNWSMKIVLKRLRQYLPNYKIKLINDFLRAEKDVFEKQKSNELYLLENIRFYPEEKKNDFNFAKKLASLADIYVNDAFAVCHRAESSVVGVPKYLPAYGGLLLKKEITMISKAIQKPQKPIVAIIGGAKIFTKINVINKLTEMADYLLIGGALANTFLCAQGYEIGKSYCEYERVVQARRLLFMAAQKHTAIILPEDVVVGDSKNSQNSGKVLKIEEIKDGENGSILDIGPETKAKFGHLIAKAKTIIWNGPLGYFENPAFRRGTDFIYYSITNNREATSIVGGGDTLAAISKKEYLDKITHISTGGGAMLEFIEKDTLPGIEALRKR